MGVGWGGVVFMYACLCGLCRWGTGDGLPCLEDAMVVQLIISASANLRAVHHRDSVTETALPSCAVPSL